MGWILKWIFMGYNLDFHDSCYWKLVPNKFWLGRKSGYICLFKNNYCWVFLLSLKKKIELWRNSVQFSRSVVSNSLRAHGSQHARPPCPSPTPGVHPNSCPSSWWCHPAIASESFPMNQLFWGGYSFEFFLSPTMNVNKFFIRLA